MIGLTPLEACRRALSSGFVKEAEPIRAHIAFLEQVDEKRPKCLRCGTPMIFRETQTLDNSPRRQDGLFSGSFEVLPLYCPNCGKMELFWPEILAKDENMAWLYQQDVK